MHIGSMEVLKQRDKSIDPCNKELKYHDEMALEKMMKNVGCQAKHWKTTSSLPYCTTLKQHQEIEEVAENVEETLPPCRSIERIITTGNGIKCEEGDNKLRLKFYFQEPVFKEIEVV